MRTTTGLHLTDAQIVTPTRFPPLLILGMWTLLAGLFIDAATSCVLAGTTGPSEPAVTQEKGNYINEEEENAYRAAQKEPDLKVRAVKLFEFYQKYPNTVLMGKFERDLTKPLEIEYNEYYEATQQADLEKRGAMLIEFLQKHPESRLNVYINQEYTKVLNEAGQAKKYEQLESLSEKWLKIHPNSQETYAFLAEATSKLQKHERYAQSLEAIYGIKPSPDLAKEILAGYQKTQNLDKQKEWTEKLFTMPELAGDYMLRFNYMTKFLAEKNYPKAEEYARLTLKSLDSIVKPDEERQAQLQKVRRASYHVIATAKMETGSYGEAITEFKKAIQAEKYDEGYYKIGQCLENLKQIDDAMIYYAKAALMGGEYAERAKARLELLYKALHNDTLIGIDKVYTKAKETSGS